jgi:hypothetical protein
MDLYSHGNIKASNTEGPVQDRTVKEYKPEAGETFSRKLEEMI